MSTVIVILIILAVFVLAVMGTVKDRKKGKGCLGNCSECLNKCNAKID